jgi:hypothetical protein
VFCVFCVCVECVVAVWVAFVWLFVSTSSRTPAMSDDDAVMVASAQATVEAESKQHRGGDEDVADSKVAAAAAAEPPTAARGSASVDNDPRSSPQQQPESKQGSQQQPSLPLQDDAWVDAPDPAKLLRPVSTVAQSATIAAAKTAAPAAATTADAADAAAVAAAVGRKGKRASFGELLALVISKLHVVVDGIDKVQALVLQHVVVVQAYVAVVLLLFGSYFLQTIRCYEAVSRLGFLDAFSLLYARIKAVANANKAGAGATKNIRNKGHANHNKATAVWLQLRPHVGELARSVFLCATCCLGILLSYLCGSLMIGASIGSRLDGYLDEFDLR